MPSRNRHVRRALAALALTVVLGGCTPEQWIAVHFGPVGQYDNAVAVARCESGLNPEAVSPGGGNHGLFQINNVHAGRFEQVTGKPWSARYTAEANTQYARWLWEQSGWQPWTCQP